MVFDVTPNYVSQWAAIKAVAQKLGVGTGGGAQVRAPGRGRHWPPAAREQRRVVGDQAAQARGGRAAQGQRNPQDGACFLRASVTMISVCAAPSFPCCPAVAVACRLCAAPQASRAGRGVARSVRSARLRRACHRPVQDLAGALPTLERPLGRDRRWFPQAHPRHGRLHRDHVISCRESHRADQRAGTGAACRDPGAGARIADRAWLWRAPGRGRRPRDHRDAPVPFPRCLRPIHRHGADPGPGRATAGARSDSTLADNRAAIGCATHDRSGSASVAPGNPAGSVTIGP